MGGGEGSGGEFRMFWRDDGGGGAGLNDGLLEGGADHTNGTCFGDNLVSDPLCAGQHFIMSGEIYLTAEATLTQNKTTALTPIQPAGSVGGTNPFFLEDTANVSGAPNFQIRFVRKICGRVAAREVCQVCDKAQVPGSERCGNRTIFSS